MYSNLEAELARRGITKTKVAQELGLTLGTLSLKLSGKSNLTLPEAIKIKKIINIEMPIEYLFEFKDKTEVINSKYKN